jgi:hypothetical protein
MFGPISNSLPQYRGQSPLSTQRTGNDEFEVLAALMMMM